jgi:DNA polymerase
VITLYLDLETFSETPIQNGTHVYAADAEIMLWAYAIGDDPVEVWDLTATPLMPNRLADALDDEGVLLTAHNSHFDRTVMNYSGYRTDIKRWRDTMVKAMAHSLPGSLSTLCEILGIPEDQAKSKRGKELVNLFCKPRPKTSKIRRATRETHPAEWAEFVEYARLDVKAMRQIDKKLPKWNYEDFELNLWHLDQQVNQRGFMVDVDLARAAIRAVDRAQLKLSDRTQEITEYDAEAGTGVRSATQRDVLLKYLLEEHGVDLPDMKASTLERRMNDENLPSMLRELLAIRLQASTSSTSKYKTLIKAVSDDHRLRGTLQFCGALRTGRYAGRMFQPHNMPRPSLKNKIIEHGIEMLKADSEDLFFDNVMQLTSSAIRGCIIAPEGKKLVVADLSNIEGRILAWLAGEQWKIRAFEIYDTYRLDEHGARITDGKGDFERMGPDLYELAYAKSFGVNPATVDKDQRQVGKVQELALGYQGGVGAFLTFAAAYNLDLEAMAEEALEAIPADIVEEATGFMQWLYTSEDKKYAKRLADGEDEKSSAEIRRVACQKIRFGLTEQAFIVCDSFKRMWRYAHPEIATWWRELEDAARTAILQPGKVVQCRRVKMIRSGAWLRIVLPSGRALCYPSPQVGGECPTCKGTGQLEIEGKKQTCPACDGEQRGRSNQISYMGINQYSRKWSRLGTYGGKLAENITQAAARDVLVENFPQIEAAGYELVLTVHDEDITEAPDLPEYNAEALAGLMSTNPKWAKGLPLAAAGFESQRYRKD